MLWLFNPAVPVLYNRKGRKWSGYCASFTPHKKLIPDAQSKEGSRHAAWQKAWVSQFTGVRAFRDSWCWELWYVNRGAHHSKTVVLFSLFSQKKKMLWREKVRSSIFCLSGEVCLLGFLPYTYGLLWPCLSTSRNIPAVCRGRNWHLENKKSCCSWHILQL